MKERDIILTDVSPRKTAMESRPQLDARGIPIRQENQYGTCAGLTLSGLRESAGKGKDPRDTHGREGEIRQQGGREEDQRGWGGGRVGCVSGDGLSFSVLQCLLYLVNPSIHSSMKMAQDGLLSWCSVKTSASEFRCWDCRNKCSGGCAPCARFRPEMKDAVMVMLQCIHYEYNMYLGFDPGTAHQRTKSLEGPQTPRAYPLHPPPLQRHP